MKSYSQSEAGSTSSKYDYIKTLTKEELMCGLEEEMAKETDLTMDMKKIDIYLVALKKLNPSNLNVDVNASLINFNKKTSSAVIDFAAAKRKKLWRFPKVLKCFSSLAATLVFTVGMATAASEGGFKIPEAITYCIAKAF